MARIPLSDLLEEVRACRLCEAHLPLGPRPVLQMGSSARLLVIGQAPGTRVHATGIPWNDPSGDRLRDWLAMDRDTFYDPARVAIMPMGFCYPGKGKGGDLPPRPECFDAWHARLRGQLPEIRLTLLIGQYAQRAYLPQWLGRVCDNVRANLPSPDAGAGEAWPEALVALPHPSPRNRRWLAQRPWFETEVVPLLRARATEALG